MTNFGYTLMTEQAGPRDLVRHAVAAEEAGFDFEVSSDHYSPWLSAQGHAPYAWTVLGAVAHATSRVGLMTYVTCPTIRYHPAVVAQKAATLQILAEGRFTLGFGHSSDEVAQVRAGAGLLADYLRAVHQQTTDYLAGLGEDDLDRVVDERWDPPVTLGARLVSVVNDDAQHLGQAAYVRGLLGA